MNDRTLLHLVLVISVLALVSNALVLQQLRATPSAIPSSDPPANADELPGMVALGPEARFCIRNTQDRPYTVRDNRRSRRVFTVKAGKTHCYTGQSNNVLWLNAPENCPGRRTTAFFTLWPHDRFCYEIKGLCYLKAHTDIKNCFPEPFTLGKAISIDEFPLAVDDPRPGSSFCLWNPGPTTWDVYTSDWSYRGPSNQRKIGTLGRGQTRCCVGCDPQDVQLKAADGSCPTTEPFSLQKYSQANCIIINGCPEEGRWQTRGMASCFWG